MWGINPVLGIGIDHIEIPRILHSINQYQESFLQRIFTEKEISYCQMRSQSVLHFAARFTVKEAASKAFGYGIGQKMGWKDVWTENASIEGQSGPPLLYLSTNLKDQLCLDFGINTPDNIHCMVSLSHSETMASAVVIFGKKFTAG